MAQRFPRRDPHVLGVAAVLVHPEVAPEILAQRHTAEPAKPATPAGEIGMDDRAVALGPSLDARPKCGHLPRNFVPHDEGQLSANPARADGHVELIRRAGVHAQHDLPDARLRVGNRFERQGTAPLMQNHGPHRSLLPGWTKSMQIETRMIAIGPEKRPFLSGDSMENYAPPDFQRYIQIMVLSN